MGTDPFTTQRDEPTTVIAELQAAGFDEAVEIGAGGFGLVFRATQVTLDRTVAIKVLTADLDVNRERFLREQRAAGRLTGHPNIVSVLEVGETPSGYPYLVMPYCARGSLHARIRRLGLLDAEEVMTLGVKLAGALDAAHQLDILHRDVKPDNILLTDYDEPALTDFGIAHIAGGFTTAKGIFTGSPAFTAPEIIGGSSSSRASDVYALGATLFAALTGHAAYERRSGEQLVAQFLRIASEPIPDLREHGIPQDVAAVIERAMARDPAQRPTAAEFGDCLRHLQATRGVPIDAMALRSGSRHGRMETPRRSRRVSGNLPQELTPFVGRRRELADVRGLLINTRVLTLVGTGGVGKTRLARAVASDRVRAFPDGVWYAALDGIDDPRLLITHVSDVLGQWCDTHERDPAEGLANLLQDKHLLLVLDNCEHLVDAAAHLVDAIAQSCPRVRILATSRTPLRAAGEATYHVPPLSMPEPTATGSEVDLDASDAVRLFVDRAREVLPEFELTAENRTSVHELVHRLDRLPLAIELAAVRLRSLTVQQIVERVTTHQAMLSWGRRSAPSRHRTMHASLHWSAELCTEDERRLWARLSIFRGTFDLDAVEAICGDESSPVDILDLLQGLVERSIIAREDHGSVVRYSMLEVVRHFGLEMLGEHSEDAQALHARHTAWFLELAIRAEAEWNTERQKYWLHTLPLDHKNIVQALSSASDNVETVDTAAEAVCALWRYYWWACGWETEGVYWVERCSRVLTTPVVRARLLLLGSLLAWTAGDSKSGAAFLAEAQDLADRTLDPLALAFAEHVRGDAAMYDRQLETAVTHFRRALSLYDKTSTSYRVDTLLMLTLACATSNDFEGAQAAHLDSLHSLAAAERFQRSYSLLYIGEALRRHGSTDQALVTVRDALRLKAELDDPFGVAWTFDIIATIACDTRQYKRAAFLLGAANHLWKSMGISTETLERLQIHEHQTRERLQAALGSAGLADQCRRGEESELGSAIAAALEHDATLGARPVQPNALTARESEIAELVARGLTNKQIASKLVIAQRTVDSHVQNVITKLGFNSRTQVAAWITTRTNED